MNTLYYTTAPGSWPNPMSRYPAKLSVLSLAWRGCAENGNEQLLGFTMLNVDRKWSAKSDDYLLNDRAYITFDPDCRAVLIDRLVCALRDDAVLAGNHLTTDIQRLAHYAQRTDPAAFAPLIQKLHAVMSSNGLLEAHRLLPSSHLPDQDLFSLMCELLRMDAPQGDYAIASKNAPLLGGYLRERSIAVWALIMSLMLSPTEQEFALRCLSIFRSVNAMREHVKQFGRGDDD